MITSYTNDKIKDVIKLKQKKHRELTGQFIVEGFHMVEEAISAHLCKEIYFTKKNVMTDIFSYEVSDEVMKKLSDCLSPQGIIAVCEKPISKSLSDNLLILDTVQDPGNLGTLLRSAKAFGFQTILYENTVDMYNSKVLRSTQGALFTLNFIETNIVEFIKNHPEYYYIGTDLHNGIPLKQFTKKPMKVALILGNEGMGVQKEILEKTNENLFIELTQMESLNVSVAGSILMYYISQMKVKS